MYTTPPPPDGHLTRAQKVQRYQQMIEGDPGMKYVHADFIPSGGTQISGMAVHTTSMTANRNDPTLLKNELSILGAGAAPVGNRGALPPHLAWRAH